MFFLNGKVSLVTHEINWTFGGKVWTPDRYYSEGVLKIGLTLDSFGLTQDRIAALKSFEDVIAQNHIDWIETGREEWVVDLDGLKQFVSVLARKLEASTIPSLDDLKGLLPIKPEFEWEMGAFGFEGANAYRVTVAMHIFKDSLVQALNVPRGIWEFLHPRIVNVARTRFESNHFADSVEAALKEINSVVKAKVKSLTGDEYDGPDLMNRAFSLSRPLIELDDLSTESGRNIQKGYMQIFAGSMIGIRNPKAHENIEIDANRAVHFLFLASLLMQKIDEAK